jgi:hypothetical protein
VLILNTVPLPALPPPTAVPYRVLPNKIKPAYGLAPSLLPVKVCRFVKTVPSVLTLNTVPLPGLPPLAAVPNRVLPDTRTPTSPNLLGHQTNEIQDIGG